VHTATAVLVFLGFSLYRALMLDTYVSAFGTAERTVAYVSSIPFMAGASGVIVGVSCAVIAARLKGARPLSLPYRVPLVGVVVACLAGCASATGAVELPVWLPVCLGVLWGAASTLVTISFSELFACEDSNLVVMLQLAFSSLVPAALTLVLAEAGPGVRLCAYVAFAATAWIAVWRGRRVFSSRDCDEGAREEGSLPSTPGTWSALRSSAMPVAAAVLFELVVGLVNMFAWAGGSSFVIASSAPMWGMLLCAGLLVGIVLVGNRAPDPDAVNIAVFSLAIVVLLALPFLGESVGEPLSVLIYTAYIFTSVLSSYCYITASAREHGDVCLVAAVVHLLTRVSLLAGLALGYACAQISDGEPLIRTGVAVAVCVYVLLAFIVLWCFRASRRAAHVEVVVERVPESFEDASRERMEALADARGLTPRECDVYLLLLKGGTAKTIAGELGVSPYTVQGHVQSLYGKLGVNKKEQAIEMFYRAE
jgi:DNA-binding CsgD family transcriptional regulator